MLSIHTIDELDKWNKIVKSFKDFDVYYLSEYTKAFEIHGDGEPTLFYYEDQEIKAMNVVMKRDISTDDKFNGKLPPNKYYDISTPYGYGGFLMEGNITNESLMRLDDEYSSLCEQEGIVSEFVRFHPVLNNSEIIKDSYDISKLGKTITMKLESQQQIWDDLSAKNRNVIRKAYKSGVEIFWGRSPKLYYDFIGLYNATMDKDNATDYYYFDDKFYESVLHDLKNNSLIFYAVYKERIIAMSMILFSNNQMHYHLSASEKEYLHFAPTNLLLYQAACWGSENGYKYFLRFIYY